MGSSRVHTAYSWISLACRNLFMIWASLRKSSESMVPIRGGPSETGRSECLKQQQIKLVIMIKFCFPASNATELLLCFKCGKTKIDMGVPGLRVFTATGVVSFHRPSNTSPNWPAPSFLSSLMDLRSISHWSTVLYDKPWVWGTSICSNRREALSLFADTGRDVGQLGRRVRTIQLTFLHGSPRRVHRPSACLE